MTRLSSANRLRLPFISILAAALAQPATAGAQQPTTSTQPLTLAEAWAGGTYAPKGGLEQAQVSTSLGFLITKRTTAMAFATGTRLGSQAADSPLTRKRNGVMAGMGFAVGL